MTAIHVCVCDCTSGYKTSRFPIDASKLNGKTESLFSEISSKLGSKENEFDVVYCGQKLERDMGLDTFNLTPQSTLFVFLKAGPARSSKDKSELQVTTEMMHLIHKSVQKPNYRKTVDQILTRHDSLQKLLRAVPGLDKDPTAISMLQDPDFLQILANRSNIHRVMKQHPLFGAAAMYIAKIVDEEHARDPTKHTRNVYSMDQMSDEEEDGNQRGAAGGAPQQPITASQLAAALAAATASARPSTSASSSSQQQQQQAASGRASASGSGTSVISPDFFQQAMQTAQSSALEQQLQQLRDMGIADENVARQALTATNGDLQAALELIFGDGGM